MPDSLRVLITDRAWPDLNVEREILQAVGAEIIEAPDADEATLCELAADCDALGACWAQVTENVVKAAKRCRVISRFGIGLDNIAIAAATAREIPVTYVPDYCVPEVADHTLAMLLALARRVPLYDARAKARVYDRVVTPPMRRLAGQTLGLVGFGRIAQAVHHRASAFGMNTITYSRTGNDHGTGCRMVELPTLLAESDFVSLHCPLTDATRQMLSTEQLAAMRPTAFLINTSRGGLIDHAALWQAIQDGEIAGAALDVFDPEPPDLSQQLFLDDRVLITPHAAFLSADSLLELRTRTATQIAHVLQGKRPEHLVNPEVWRES